MTNSSPNSGPEGQSPNPKPSLKLDNANRLRDRITQGLEQYMVESRKNEESMPDLFPGNTGEEQIEDGDKHLQD